MWTSNKYSILLLIFSVINKIINKGFTKENRLQNYTIHYLLHLLMRALGIIIWKLLFPRLFLQGSYFYLSVQAGGWGSRLIHTGSYSHVQCVYQTHEEPTGHSMIVDQVKCTVTSHLVKEYILLFGLYHSTSVLPHCSQNLESVYSHILFQLPHTNISSNKNSCPTNTSTVMEDNTMV